LDFLFRIVLYWHLDLARRHSPLLLGMSFGRSPYAAVAGIGRQSFPCRAAHCAVRLYRPRAEILSGWWKFPEAQAVN
jgi:hypothetical protein